MQVPNPSQQHKIMVRMPFHARSVPCVPPRMGASQESQQQPTVSQLLQVEAVENHMPEIVIVDEIGTTAEALACRTIAERGVQLIGTAHGLLLENILKNPTLADSVGGIQSVTLGELFLSSAVANEESVTPHMQVDGCCSCCVKYKCAAAWCNRRRRGPREREPEDCTGTEGTCDVSSGDRDAGEGTVGHALDRGLGGLCASGQGPHCPGEHCHQACRRSTLGNACKVRIRGVGR